MRLHSEGTLTPTNSPTAPVRALKAPYIALFGFTEVMKDRIVDPEFLATEYPGVLVGTSGGKIVYGIKFHDAQCEHTAKKVLDKFNRDYVAEHNLVWTRFSAVFRFTLVHPDVSKVTWRQEKYRFTGKPPAVLKLNEDQLFTAAYVKMCEMDGLELVHPFLTRNVSDMITFLDTIPLHVWTDDEDAVNDYDDRLPCMLELMLPFQGDDLWPELHKSVKNLVHRTNINTRSPLLPYEITSLHTAVVDIFENKK